MGNNMAVTTVFAHFDLDAFFASVEVLDNPELRGKPVIVGGTGRRGVVAACTYEARQYGVRSAMSSVEAQRRCPNAIFLRGNYRRYSEKSKEVFDVVHEYTPFIEPLGLDEAFLDISGTSSLFGSPEQFAQTLRNGVCERTGLNCSIGVASVKFLTKLASEAAKPRATISGVEPGSGVVVIEPGRELEFLHPLPIRAMWGVGPKTHAKLDRFGIRTVGDLAAIPLDALTASVGIGSAEHLHALAHAQDSRPISLERERKSIGREQTFFRDYFTHEELSLELRSLCEDVESTLHTKGLGAFTVTLKCKFKDFASITRSRTIETPIWTADDLHDIATELLQGVDVSYGVRLIGISTSQLVSRDVEQLTFDSGVVTRENTREAVLDVRERFGDSAIVSARLLQKAQKRDDKWGPNAQNT